MKNSFNDIFGQLQDRFLSLNEAKKALQEETERLKKDSADAFREAARLKVLNSVVFHETRIPLEAISDILAMSAPGGGETAFMNAATASSVMKFNLELVSYLQSYLTPDFDPEFNLETEFDFNEIMFTALCSLYGKFKKKNVYISTKFYMTPAIVAADKYKFFCILLNLLDNSLKFSRPDDRITISTSLTSDKMLKIEFLDHGEGFDESLVKSYFPDGRLAVSVNENDPRTGLLIIYKYLQQIGGSLELDSRSGDGSALSLCVRLSESCDFYTLEEELTDEEQFDEAIINRLHPDSASQGALRQGAAVVEKPLEMNILIIDDDASVTASIKSALDAFQASFKGTFNVLHLTPSKSVIEEAVSFAPNVIIIEPVLKAADGFEIMQRIKGNVEISLVPVIALSRIKCQNRAMKLGAAGYLSKPLNAASFVNILKNLSAAPGQAGTAGVDIDQMLRSIV